MDTASDREDFLKSVSMEDSSRNKVESYEPFRNVKRYLSCLWSSSRKQEKEIGTACGYLNLNKFHRRIEQWLSLERGMPVIFFDIIGGEYRILEISLEADQGEYDQASRKTILPQNFSVLLKPRLSEVRQFPEGLSEAEAIDYLKGVSKEKNMRCIIKYPCILDIMINPDGKVWHYRYRPSMKKQKGIIFFSTEGLRTETTTIA